MQTGNQNLKWLLPSGITLLNWVAGVFAIVTASRGMVLESALFILAAALFDFFDGMVARLMDAQSKVGAELDSLADALSFGLAPSFLLYTILLERHADVWLLYLVFLPAAAAVLRLALYNARHLDEQHFTGLPVPASALFFSGIVLSLPLSDIGWLHSIAAYPAFWAGIVIFNGLMMLMPIRMFSLKFKQLSWAGNEITWIFLIISAVLLVVFQIIALPLVIVLYIIMSLIFHVISLNNKDL